MNKKMGIDAPVNKANLKNDDDSDDYNEEIEKNWNHIWREEHQKDLEK